MTLDDVNSIDPAVPCVCADTCVGFECTKRRSLTLCDAGKFTRARALLEFAIAQDDSDDRLRDLLRLVYDAKMAHNTTTRPQQQQQQQQQCDAADSAISKATVSGAFTGKRRRLVDENAMATTPPSFSVASTAGVATNTTTNIADTGSTIAAAAGTTEPTAGSSLTGSYGEAGPASAPAAAFALSEQKLSTLHEHLSCSICAELLFEPVTTPCGHTFCRDCLCRAVDFTDTCPTCRTVLHMEDPSKLPVTNLLRDAIQTCFPAEYEQRRRDATAETPTAENTMSRLPLFPLNAVVFPRMRYPMHIFEARYRLMLRRILVGSRKFGLIALKRTPEGGSELCDVGCVLEVTKAERYPDGRSLIETVARERFKLLTRTEVDGYLVGRTEVFEDNDGIDTNEAREVEGKVRAIVDKLLDRGVKLPVIAGNVPSEEQGPGALGMWLAGVLVSDHNGRQALLEMQNSTTRLKEMLSYLEGFRDSMQANADSGRDCCIQ